MSSGFDHHDAHASVYTSLYDQERGELSEIDVLDQNITRMEQDIQAMLRSLTELKRKRNSRLPAARLPPEIVSEIFIWHRDGHTRPESVGGTSSTSIKTSWIHVSHVCHYWRQVALSTPQLWVYVDLRRVQAACEHIRRACSLSLRPYMLNGGGPPTDELLELVRNHPGYITSITLNGTYIEQKICITTLAPSLAQNLRVLEIVGEKDPTTPTPIQDISLPRLEEISLKWCIFEWTCVLFSSCASSLRRLTLVGGGTPRYPHNIFHVLGSMHLLKHLALSYSVRQVDAPPDDTAVANMRSLKSLYISDYWKQCKFLYTHISIPGECDCQIYVERANKMSTSATIEVLRLLASPTLHAVQVDIKSNFVRVYAWLDATRRRIRKLVLRLARWDAVLLLQTIGDELSKHAASLTLLTEVPLTSADVRALSGGAAAVATKFALLSSPCVLPVVAECMADTENFLPRLKDLGFMDVDMGVVEGEASDKWIQALSKRERVDAHITVDFNRFCVVSEQLLTRLQEHLRVKRPMKFHARSTPFK